MKAKLGLLAWAAGVVVGALPSVNLAQEQPARPASAVDTPNVILIVADDLGYGELSCQGAKTVSTPNIDSIAYNGVRFTDGYVTCPVCSPSRAGLISGRYQTRFGHELNPDAREPLNFGLPKTVATIGRRMKENGYATAMFGKWHLGDQPGYRPLERGFDQFWGFYAGGHGYRGTKPDNPLIDGLRVVETQPQNLTDVLTGHATEFIRTNKSRPFFLMVTYNAVHVPVDMDPTREQRFGYLRDKRSRAVRTMLAAMDDGVGSILWTLNSTNLLDNTLLIFVSDNGNTPDSQIEDNGGFRGGKTTMYEGGIRVPMMMQWPKAMPAGQTYRKPVISLDLTATIMAAGGADLSKHPELDGVDLMPYLTAQKSGDPHDMLFWRYGPHGVVRKGNYKRIRDANYPPELYDLAADPAETTNLAAANPAIVAELDEAYEKWNVDNIENLWGIWYPKPATRPAATTKPK